MLNIIKDILRKNKHACIIIVEDEKPILVVNSFEEYQRLFNDSVEVGGSKIAQKPPFTQSDLSLKENEGAALDEINQEIINLQNPRERNMRIGEDVEGLGGIEEIRVEDIPLV